MEEYSALQSEVLQDPTSVFLWLQLAVAAAATAPGTPSAARETLTVLERALRHHPHDVRLWQRLLDTKLALCSAFFSQIPSYVALHKDLVRLFERALTALPQESLIWERYLRFLMFPFQAPPPSKGIDDAKTSASSSSTPHGFGFQSASSQQKWYSAVGANLTRIRVELFRALQVLPLGKHESIWKLMRRWTIADCTTPGVTPVIPATAVHQLWEAMLRGNNSDYVHALYVQLLVARQENRRLVRFLLRVVAESSRLASSSLAHRTTQSNQEGGEPFTLSAERLRDALKHPVALGGGGVSNSTFLALPQVQRQRLPAFLKEPRLWLVVTSVLTEASSAVSDGEALRPEELLLLLRVGRYHAADPTSLSHAVAVTLMRLGAFSAARHLLLDLLLTTADPHLFQDAFSVLVQMEASLVDAVALQSASAEGAAVLSDSITKGNALMEYALETQSGRSGWLHGAEDSGANPLLTPTDVLIALQPLLLNGAQLRQRPHMVELWLKRAELLFELSASQGKADSDAGTVEQLEALFQQAFLSVRVGASTANNKSSDIFANHTASSRSDGTKQQEEDHVAGSAHVFHLYCAYAAVMWRVERPDNAIAILRRGAFYASFPASSGGAHPLSHLKNPFGALVEPDDDVALNAALFGRLVEYLILSYSNQKEAGAAEETVLLLNGKVWDALRAMLETELVTAHLIDDTKAKPAATVLLAVASVSPALLTQTTLAQQQPLIHSGGGSMTTTSRTLMQMQLHNQGVDPSLASGASAAGGGATFVARRNKRVLAAAMFQGGDSEPTTQRTTDVASFPTATTATKNNATNHNSFNSAISSRHRVLLSPALWSLVLDVALSAGGPTGSAVQQVTRWVSLLGMMTTDFVCRLGTSFFQAGCLAQGTNLFEEALDQMTQPCARFVLSETYAALFFQHCGNHHLSPSLSDRNNTDATSKAPPTKFQRMERLREILDVGVASIQTGAAGGTKQSDHHPAAASLLSPLTRDADRCFRFLLAYAKLEETYGLVSKALSLLAYATALAYHVTTAELHNRPNNNTSKDPSSPSGPAAAGGNDPSSTLTASESRYLSLLDVLLFRTLSLHGSERFAEVMTGEIKRSHRPVVLMELVLKFNAEQIRCGEVARARAIFDACCASQNPELAHGAKFWAAWGDMEVRLGGAEQFVFVQRKRRNALASFSKSEVSYEQ